MEYEAIRAVLGFTPEEYSARVRREGNTLIVTDMTDKELASALATADHETARQARLAKLNAPSLEARVAALEAKLLAKV